MVIVREGGRLPVLAGEQACGERPECQEREATFAAQWQLALFYVAIEQVVGALIRRQGSDGQRPRDLQVSGVAEPDREGLSLELQPIERFELPFPPFERFVQLHQVHAVRGEAAQRRLE